MTLFYEKKKYFWPAVTFEHLLAVC